VHLLTASSAPAGLLAILATIHGDIGSAFLWMAYTLAVDAVDGTLARAVKVKEVVRRSTAAASTTSSTTSRTSWCRPSSWCTRACSAAAAVPVASLVLVASGYGFSQTAAKTPTTSSPASRRTGTSSRSTCTCSQWPRPLAASVVALLAILVFVPLRYAYPSRDVRAPPPPR
jgi:phosphatidylcholine synthase